MTNFEIADTDMKVFEIADMHADTDMIFLKNRGHGADKPWTRGGQAADTRVHRSLITIANWLTIRNSNECDKTGSIFQNEKS